MILFVGFMIIMLVDCLYLIKKIRKQGVKVYLKVMGKNGVLLGMMIGVTVFISAKFQLVLRYRLLLILAAITCTILSLNWFLEFVHQQKLFREKCYFLLRLCAYFRNSQKVRHALEEALDGSNEEFLHKQEILESCDKGDSLEVILLSISRHYLVHALIYILETSERVSSKYTNQQLTSLESDIEMWMSSTNKYYYEELREQKKVQALALLSCLIAYLAQRMLLGAFDITDTSFYQNLVFSFLLGIIVVVTLVVKRISKPWILKEETL